MTPLHEAASRAFGSPFEAASLMFSHATADAGVRRRASERDVAAELRARSAEMRAAMARRRDAAANADADADADDTEYETDTESLRRLDLVVQPLRAYLEQRDTFLRDNKARSGRVGDVVWLPVRRAPHVVGPVIPYADGRCG